MEKKLLFTDNQGISLALSNIQFFRQRLQDIINEFNKLQLGVKMDKEIFHSLLSDAEGTVRNIYKNRIPDIDANTGLSLDKDSLLKNVKLPNFKALREAVNVVNIEKNDGRYLPLFDVSATVTINKERLNTYLDKYKFYSDESTVIKLYNQLNQAGVILSAVNASTGFMASTSSVINFNLGELFKFNPDKEIELKREGFLQLARKLK